MTHSPVCQFAAMPTACDRVPPTHAAADRWQHLPVDCRAEDDLPVDPRTWSRADVAAWVSRGGGLPDRFPMNGKALCLMSREMFAARVPRRGDRLHQDFRRRLSRALALHDLVEKLQKASKQ